jgi:hypothetical protein
MNKLSNTSKIILLAVVIVVAGALIIWFNGSSQSGPNLTNLVNATNTLQQAANNNANATTTAATTKGGGGTPAKTTGTSAPILFVTPVPGDTWKIATTNPIQWSREAGVTGQIELLNASTKNLVGVILNEIGTHQTSYSWNTRDIYLSRTSPSKTTVTPGRYLIKISFDGNNLSPITSQPITIEQ